MAKINLINIDNLFGINNLNLDEKRMYDEIQAEGGETTPLHVHKFCPDKERAKFKVKG